MRKEQYSLLLVICNLKHLALFDLIISREIYQHKGLIISFTFLIKKKKIQRYPDIWYVADIAHTNSIGAINQQ